MYISIPEPIKNIGAIVLLFLFVFGVPFSFLAVNTSKLAWLLLLGLVILQLVGKPISLHLNKRLFTAFLYLLFMVVISLAYAVVYQTYDFSIPYAYSIMAVEAFFGGVLFYVVFLKRKGLDDLLNYFIVICLIQAMVILLMFAVPAIRDFVFSITNNNAVLLYERYGGFRGLGLAASVTYDLAVLLSIGMMFISYMLCTSEKNEFYYIVSWIIILFAVSMTGRTGWIGVLFSLMIFLSFYRSRIAVSSLVKFLIYIPLIIFLGGVGLLLFSPSIIEKVVTIVVPYAFELLINLIDEGSVSTSSTNNLMAMYFSAQENTILFGDGYWKNPNGLGYYMGTDAGYMRQLLFYGLLPSIFLYLFYAVGFLMMYKKAKLYKKFQIIVAFLALYYFVVQIKGSFLTGSGMNIKLFFILLVFLYLKERELKIGCNRLYSKYS